MGAFAELPSILTTTGGTLPDGSILELIVPVGETPINFMHWTGGTTAIIAPSITVGNTIYMPHSIDQSLRQAMYFPRELGAYVPADELITTIAAIVQEVLDIDHAKAVAISVWVRSTWFSDCSPAPVPLLFYTPDARTAALAFQVLRAMTRRGLYVAEVNSHLPWELAPTLLLQNSMLSPKQRKLYSLANRKGVVVPVRGSMVFELACSKAIHMDSIDGRDGWGEDALSILLPPARRGLLSQPEVAEIAARTQALFLYFRLANLAALAAAIPPPPKPLNNSHLASALLLGAWQEPEVLKAITPILHTQEEAQQENKNVDPCAAILECLWGPAHDSESLSVTAVQKRVHALLRSRGEVIELGAREIGWRLAQLNLRRKRESRGMVLPFSATIRSQIHQLVQRYGLDLPEHSKCSNCQSCSTAAATEPV